MRGASTASHSLLARLALWAIRLYQRHLSPRKGFSCAYRVVTGGASCSAHGYQVIWRHGLAAGLPLLRRRLRRCGEVHRAAQSTRNPVLHYQRGECDINPCDGDGCGLGMPRGRSCLSNTARDCGCNLLEFVLDILFDKDERRKRKQQRQQRRRGRR